MGASLLDRVRSSYSGGSTGGAPSMSSSFLDNVRKRYQVTDTGGDTPAPAPQGSVLDRIKASTSPSPYFQGFTDSGAFLGISDQKDPYSGRPFFAYKTSPDQATTTDKTRTAPMVNPEVATTTPRSTFTNPRMPESVSQRIRANLNATPSQELDHQLALAVGGSNDPSNLKLVPAEKNQAASALEGKLSSDVSTGAMSLFQAQNAEAKAKGLPAPWTDGQVAEARTPVGTLKNVLGGAWDAVKGFAGTVLDYTVQGVEHPGPTVQGVVQSAVVSPLAFLEGLGNAVLSVESKGIEKLTGKPLPPAPSLLADLQGGKQGHSVFQVLENMNNAVARTPDEQKAYATGNFLGWLVPYSEIAKGTEAALKTLPLAPKVARFIPFMSEAVGFIGTGQVLHKPEDGSRAQQLVNDAAALALFQVGGLALSRVSSPIIRALQNRLSEWAKKDVAEALQPVADQVKSGEKVPIETLDHAVTTANDAIKKDTGMDAKGLLQNELGIEPPKPEGSVTIPREPALSPEHKVIEDSVAKAVESSPDKYVQEYLKKNGNVVNTDQARELFPQYTADRTRSAAVHEPASYVAKQAYKELLDSERGKGNNTVLFTAGGTGAGKTTAIRQLKNAADYPIIFDTNMAAADSAAAKMENALAKGYRVEIALVYNDIKTSLTNALGRAERMRQNLGSGRTLPINEHVNTHTGSLDAFISLLQRYSKNKNVDMAVIDASGDTARAITDPKEMLAFLKKMGYSGDNAALQKELEQHVIDAHKAGTISAETARGFLGQSHGVPEKPNGLSQRTAKGEVGQPSVPEPKAKGSGTVVLASGVNPNLDKFIADDLGPALKGAGEGAGRTWDFIKKLLVPVARGPLARQSAAVLRKELGTMARSRELAYRSMLGARKVFDRYSKDEALTFIDNFERGATNPGAEEFTKVAREAMDSRWKQIQQIKGSDAYIENYYPHEYADPEKAAKALAGYAKRPFEGTKSFLKQRKIPTIKEAVSLGLEPATYNPVDAIMSHIANMDRFLMASRVWTQYKELGLRKFVPTGGEIPKGWVKVNDKISTVFQFSPEEKGLVLRGGFYMPEQAATILNNYLSPGLRSNPIYNAFRMLGNDLNQVQLGLSAFHAGFTSADAVISKAALEIQKVTQGSSSLGQRFTSFVKALTLPVTAPYYLWKNITRGNALLEDYFKHTPDVPQLVDALEKAGGRVNMDSIYMNDAVTNFLKALRAENYIGATLRAPGAAIEAAAKPLMQWLVPRQKLGIFADLAKNVLEQAQAEGWDEMKTVLRLQESWDAVDNRMGQLVYDNLFWHKALKDIGMVATRSLGWNLGTLRIAGSATASLIENAKAAATLGKKGEFRMTPNLAYTIALPYVAAVWGGMLMYLYTGHGPQQLLDYFYPKTGKYKSDGTPERITLPTYMKDVFAYKTEGVQTALNKLHPELAAIVDMLQNQDYYGTEIRNPNDPLVKQMEDLALYQAEQFVPFSITNYVQRSKAEGPSAGLFAQTFFGITPAPSYITKTPLQTEIATLYDKRFGGGTQTKEQAQLQQAKAHARQLYLEGDTAGANKALAALVTSGAVKNVTQFVKDADIPSDVKLFQALPPEDQSALLKKMELYQLERYAWYANKDVKAKLGDISDNGKAFVGLVNKGTVKQPVWKKGQDTNLTTQERP